MPSRRSSAPDVVPLIMSVRNASPETWNTMRSPACSSKMVERTEMASASPTAPRSPPYTMKNASFGVVPGPMFESSG